MHPPPGRSVLPDCHTLTPYHDTPETWQEAAELWKLPIETVSNSEGGFERVYQGTSLIARWPLTLDPEQTWEASVYWTAGVAQPGTE